MAKKYWKMRDSLARPFRDIILPFSVLIAGYFALPAIVSLWDEILSSLILIELVFDASPLRL